MPALALFVLVAAQPQTVTVPAGFYSVKDLAQVLSSQNLSVRAAATCQDDVYAVRLQNVPWKDARDALTSDERLEVREEDGTWLITLNQQTANRERAAWQRYERAAFDQIHEVYGTAIEHCRKLVGLNLEETDQALTRLQPPKGSDLKKFASHTLAYLAMDAKDIPFFTVALPAMLSDPREKPIFGVTRGTTLKETPFSIVPTGNPRDFNYAGLNLATLSEPDYERMIRQFKISGRLLFEPISLTVGLRTFFSIPTAGEPFQGYMYSCLSPARFRAEIGEEQTWGAEELARKKTREQRSEEVARQLPSGARMPRHAMPLSEALLRHADLSNASLVHFVSPVFDPRIYCREPETLPEIINDVNQGRLDPTWLKQILEERIDQQSGWYEKAGWIQGTRLTVEKTGSVVVVRNELRFMDWFCTDRRDLPLTVRNAFFRGQTPSMDSIVQSIAATSPSIWTNSFFPAGFLRVTNPVTFRPIAMALQESQVLRTALGAWPTELPIEKLEPAARAALLKGLGDSAPFVNAYTRTMVDSGGNPNTLADVLERSSASGSIKINREGDRWEIVIARQGSESWRTWVQGVSLGP